MGPRLSKESLHEGQPSVPPGLSACQGSGVASDRNPTPDNFSQRERARALWTLGRMERPDCKMSSEGSNLRPTGNRAQRWPRLPLPDSASLCSSLPIGFWISQGGLTGNREVERAGALSP